MVNTLDILSGMLSGIVHVAVMVGAYTLVRWTARHLMAFLADDECYGDTVRVNSIERFDLIGVACFSLLGMGWMSSTRVPSWCFKGYLEHVRQAIAYIIEPLMHAVMAVVIYSIMVLGWSSFAAQQGLLAGLQFHTSSLAQQSLLLSKYMHPLVGQYFFASNFLLGAWCFTHIFLCMLTSTAQIVQLIFLAILGDQQLSRDTFFFAYLITFVGVSRILGPIIIQGLMHILATVGTVIVSGVWL